MLNTELQNTVTEEVTEAVAKEGMSGTKKVLIVTGVVLGLAGLGLLVRFGLKKRAEKKAQKEAAEQAE